MNIRTRIVIGLHAPFYALKVVAITAFVLVVLPTAFFIDHKLSIGAIVADAWDYWKHCVKYKRP